MSYRFLKPPLSYIYLFIYSLHRQTADTHTRTRRHTGTRFSSRVELDVGAVDAGEGAAAI